MRGKMGSLPDTILRVFERIAQSCGIRLYGLTRGHYFPGYLAVVLLFAKRATQACGRRLLTERPMILPASATATEIPKLPVIETLGRRKVADPPLSKNPPVFNPATFLQVLWVREAY